MTSSVRMCVNVLSGSCKDRHDEVYMYMHTCAFSTDMCAGMCACVSIGTSSLNRGAAVNLRVFSEHGGSRSKYENLIMNGMLNGMLNDMPAVCPNGVLIGVVTCSTSRLAICTMAWSMA